MKHFIALLLVSTTLCSASVAIRPICYANEQGVADCRNPPTRSSAVRILKTLRVLTGFAAPGDLAWMDKSQQYAEQSTEAMLWDHYVQQNIDKFKSVSPNVNLTSANEWINTAAAHVQTAIENQETTEFGKWLKVASEVVKMEELPSDVLKYIKENPGKTAFYVVAGVAFFNPGGVTGPLLNLAGFEEIGHRAKTLSTLWQRTYGAAVPGGSWLSTCTSAGMGGYGEAVLNEMCQSGAVAAGIAKAGVDLVQSGTASRASKV
ncbi:hypothetical protein LTR56_013874 [Elasticomyces elasticus]|nr:hypothetical protein LTR22_026034 [Elasticomyces elasticus]KAK3636978.1 hypothetical protein LTR56_013874 [Elasticomyces elasticus]KAK4924546.1 hypothetical protein LTR49_008436 [Elasticomyces elasticus]KAK5761745.1 hypothetical protein LTS12_008178 [Elasticomyces elasticus]